MRVRIHRGTQEIGGNCIEVESGGKRLVLDVGLPLWAGDPAAVPLPPVDGFVERDASLLGVVISHPHRDHFGLAHRIPRHVPFFMGADARRLLKAALDFTDGGLDLADVTPLRHRHPLRVGRFVVTPFLNDHSAFDAYSLLIEADGRTLFYTGDIRGHGRKAKLFEELLTEGPKDVDVLLLEGTNVGRQPRAETPATEQDLETDVVETLRRTKGIALACFSPQNVDRLVTFYRAAKRAGRSLVIDAYAAHLLDAIGRPSLPNAQWRDVRVFLPRVMARRIRRTGRFDLINRYRARRIYPEDLGRSPARFVMLFRESMCGDLEKSGGLEGGRVLHSQWPGYLDAPSSKLTQWCREHALDLEVHHTSGHATVVDLARLVDALKPARVVPIHSTATDRFEDFFTNVRLADDGCWWDIG